MLKMLRMNVYHGTLTGPQTSYEQRTLDQFSGPLQTFQTTVTTNIQPQTPRWSPPPPQFGVAFACSLSVLYLSQRPIVSIQGEELRRAQLQPGRLAGAQSHNIPQLRGLSNDRAQRHRAVAAEALQPEPAVGATGDTAAGVYLEAWA